VAAGCLALALAACSGKEESAAPGRGACRCRTRRTGGCCQGAVHGHRAAAVGQPGAAREPHVPAGDNAIEYYLALRDKTPDDASVKSALTDLLPYTLIAAEQHLGREDYTEAQRLVALIEKVDASAPALPRLKDGLAKGVQNAAKRTEAEAEKAKKDAEDRSKQQTEQQRLASSAPRKPTRPSRLPRSRMPRAATTSARKPSARPPPAAKPSRSSSRPPPSRPAPHARPPPASATLRPVSTPAPLSGEALRSGTSGEVLVEITVGTDGSVVNARVLRATPGRVFDREALNAVKRWRFEPVSAPVTTRRTLVFAPGN
jgi:protein TonB